MSSYIRTCSIFSDAIEQLIASGCLTQSCLTRNFHVGSDPSHVVSPHRHRGSPRDAECDQFHHHHHRTVSPIHHRPALPPDSTVDGHRETSPCQHRNVSQLIGTVLRNGGALTGEQQTMLRHLCDRCAQTLAFAVCGQLQDLSKQLQVLQQVKTPVKTDRCDGPLQDLLTRLQLDYEDEHQKVCSLRQDLMQLEQTKVGMPEL